MDTAGRRDSFINITPLCVFLVVIMMSTSNSKATADVFSTEEIMISTSIAKPATNVLLTNEALSQGAKLSYAQGKASLELGFDCNLVLYDDQRVKVWQSNTSKAFFVFPRCNLSFTDNGRLALKGTSFTGPISWISPNVNSKDGKYIAVLLPEGKLSIYGPSIWAVGDVKERIGNSSRNNDNRMVSSMIKSRNEHMVSNILFSGDILIDHGRRYDQSKLADNGYSFTITKACELVLQDSDGNVSWRTWANGNGKNCFARLNKSGELAIWEILDDANELVWVNELAVETQRGNYVLVMQRKGNAVIYGPEVWSIPETSGFIKMSTDEK